MSLHQLQKTLLQEEDSKGNWALSSAFITVPNEKQNVTRSYDALRY